MKTLQNFTIALSFFLCSVMSLSSQSLETFFKYEGVATLAQMAHPTSTMSQGYYEVSGSDVYVTMKFTDGVTTKVKLTTYKGWITDLIVTYDNDWFPPFVGVELIKDLAMEIAREEQAQSSEVISRFEAYLQKSFQSFNGREIACLVLSLMFFAY